MPRPTSAPRWRALIAEFTRSDETVAGFCRLRGLKAPTFYMWRRRLSADGAPPRPSAPFLPVHIGPKPTSARSPAPDSSGVELVLAGGRRLRLERGFDLAVLAAALAALEGAPC